MTDREQIRRDAEECVSGETVWIGGAETWAQRWLDLLAELEQAERERDEAVAVNQNLVPVLNSAEARLAKVPALVESLREISRRNWAGWQAEHAKKALTVWDQE